MPVKNSGKALLSLFLLFTFSASYSNDGAFKGSGNQLIPVYETAVSVKKEILTINRINDKNVAITVYYEFFNPKADKELEVGFEAASPFGDVDPRPVNGHHPYISQFTVNMNDAAVPFKVAIVSDSLYYKNGVYKSKTVAWANKACDESDQVDFFYVYHFKAHFKPGINIIKHTYTAQLSGSVMEKYSYEYILTAACRWANKQIDDFTLQINMGDWQDVCIPHTFFTAATDWQVPQETRTRVLKKHQKETDTTEFYIRKGTLVLQQVNFKPKDELFITSPNYAFYQSERLNARGITDYKFSFKHDPLPFAIEDQDGIMDPADEASKRILKNLPYARRGYVFKSPELQTYFERQPWYVKDATYEPVMAALTSKEQEWLKKLQ